MGGMWRKEKGEGEESDEEEDEENSGERRTT